MRSHSVAISLLAGLFSAGFSLGAYAKECKAFPAAEASECLASQLIVEERRLKTEYEKMLAMVSNNDPEQPEPAHRLLVEAQRNWRAFRDTHCEHQGFVEGGVEMYKGVARRQCLVKLTRERLGVLRVLKRSYIEAP